VTKQAPSDAALAGDQMIELEAPGSPTPKEDQELQIDEASTRKPKKFSSQTINQLLRQAYELERVIKKKNRKLIQANKKAHKVIKYLMLQKAKHLNHPSLEDLAQAAEDLNEQP
jgi:hypothetical protein